MQDDWLTTDPVWTLDAWLAQKVHGGGMTAAVAILDEVLDELRDEGVFVPIEALERWGRQGLCTIRRFRDWPEPEPGVQGLLLDRACECGRVVPLVAKPADEWAIAPPLPQHADRLQDLMRSLFDAANAVQPGAISAQALVEAHPCEVGSPRFVAPRGVWIEGASMDVAMLLASLAALAPVPLTLMRAAVAVVQPDGTRLFPVEAEQQKLAAFVRERGRGSLLVRADHDAEAAAFDACFDVVWAVADLRDLARRLLASGMLTRFARPAPISAAVAAHVVARLEFLRDCGRHADLLQLADRMSEAQWDEPVPLRRRLAALPMVPAALRHLGRYEEAIAAAGSWRDRVAASEEFSHEDCAEADLELAASYFDPMRLEEALALLTAWIQRLDRDPRLLRAVLRVRIWNTTARTLSLAGLPGWDALFRRSLALQAVQEPDSLPRTRNYYAEACLRVDRIADAEALLATAAPADPYAARHLAEAARRRGSAWASPIVDGTSVDATGANHALGLYLLATARQRRAPADAIGRFARAAQCFRHDLGRTNTGNVLWILVHAVEFAAAKLRRDVAAATQAAVRLQDHVTQPGLARLYERLRDGLPRDGGSDYEPLLEQLPW